MMKKRKPIGILVPLVLLLLAADPFAAAGTDIPDRPYFGQAPPGTAPELFAPGIVSTAAHELAVTVSPDLREFYVSRSSLNWLTSIVCFKRTARGWSGPELAPFIKGWADVYPFYSAGENAIFFNSGRPLPGTEGGKPLRTIWVTRRSGANWSAAEILSEQLDLSLHMTHPSVARSGNIYFNSTMNGSLGGSDIYVLERKGNGYGAIRNLGPAVNSAQPEFHPFIAPDESYLIFDSPRPEGLGGNDLYVSFRQPDGAWSPAVNMGKGINSEDADMRAFVSPDGKYLFFSSTRANPQDRVEDEHPTYEAFANMIQGPGNGSQDIYWVSAAVIEPLKYARAAE